VDEAAQIVGPDRADESGGSGGSDDPVALTPSFIELYHESYAPMVRLAYALISSQPLAEDLVQDVFLRVHAKWARVEKPRAYVRQAVVNACRSAGRKARSARKAIDRFRPTVVSLEADEMFDALSALPYRQRAALVLQFYEGLTHAEIADLLHCRVGTVASLVHRGLAELRRVVDR